MLRVILTIVQVFASLAIIGLVLLQRGKGAEAGAGLARALRARFSGGAVPARRSRVPRRFLPRSS